MGRHGISRGINAAQLFKTKKNRLVSHKKCKEKRDRKRDCGEKLGALQDNPPRVKSPARGEKGKRRGTGPRSRGKRNKGSC